MKMTGIDQHVLTIILVYGDFQKSYHLKKIINKNENVPQACHSNARWGGMHHEIGWKSLQNAWQTIIIKYLSWKRLVIKIFLFWKCDV